MKLGIIGLDFNSGNKGCEALAYGFLEILNGVAKRNNEIVEVYLLQKLPTRKFIKDKFSVNKIYEYYKPKYEYSNLNIEQILLLHTSKTIFYHYKMNILDYVIDFTGGDSFSDIYGMDRFMTRTKFKENIIRHNKPLILGSQTIGPFKSKVACELASKVINECKEVFVRDELSYNYTKKISGRCAILTTDVAFALPYKKQNLESINKIKIGFNASGLLWNGGYSGNNQFELKIDYKKYCEELLSMLTKDESYEVHLILHSFENNNTNIFDNDLVAAKQLKEKYPSTIISPLFNSCIDAKNYISAMDILIGARMHATVAAYSSKVPVIPFAYSRKFKGLFNSLGYKYIIEGMSMNTEEAVKTTIEWIEKRDKLLEDIKEGHKIIDNKIKIFESKLEELFF